MSEQVAPPPSANPEQPHPAQQAQWAEQAPPPAGQVPPPAEPEAKKSGGKKALSIIGAIVVFVVIAGLKFGVATAIRNVFDKDATAEAKVGDCIAKLPEVLGTEEEEVDDAKIVDCTSTEAVYNVVGRVDGQTEAQAQAGTACEPFFKEGQDGYLFYSIEPGKKGYLLCLTEKA
ncbi:LppU/SCO3897 family protein [Micromonospora avicenniae]|uniref:LppU/SCO3897 family protein n=1 Tax=Micromonospora avicenniae TaxID=1198245 RepID=UPI0034292CEF